MAAANTDLLRKKKSLYASSLTVGITNSDTTMTLNSTSGLATDTGIGLTIDRVDSSGDSLGSQVERILGVVSGSTVTNMLRGQDGTNAQSHLAGAIVEDIWDADTWNDMIDWALVGHTQAGAHAANLPLTTPKITTSIKDTNGNEIITISATGSAVNEIGVTNAATGNRPLVAAVGDDTNIGLDISGKGTGGVTIWSGNRSREIAIFAEVASAVNETTITSAATGNNPSVAASGGDTNISLDLKGKGTGTVRKPASVSIQVVGGTTDLTTGDGKFYFTVPPELNGMVLSAVHARVVTAGTTNTTDIQLHNVTDAVDILSTKLTIDSGETGSDTAATAAVINTSNDDMATNDLIRIDVDAVSTTAPKGLIVRLTFGY